MAKLIKKIKNISGSKITWNGQQIENNAYYQIQPLEEYRWMNDPILESAITASTPTALVNNNMEDITDAERALDYLHQKDVIGTDFKYSVSEELSFVTGTIVMQNKCRLTTYNLPSGKYRIAWYYEWKFTSTRDHFIARVRIDETDLNQISYLTVKPMDNGNWHDVSGFYYTEDDFSGVHIIDIDFGTSDANETAYMKRARLEIWRMDGS